MDNKTFGIEMERRTKEFALRIIRLSSTLPSTPEGYVIRNQLTKSGTSVGANYREANRSRSKADFQNKVSICETEASETLYWIELAVGSKWMTWDQTKWEYEECKELLAIFTSIGKK